MTLADFTAPEMIVPQLQGGDAASALQELSVVLQRAGKIPDLLRFYHAALNRELLVGTDMEPGMAFPHARLAELTEVTFAFGRSATPLAWGNGGVHSVRLVFLSAVPATDSVRYLNLISGLARLSRQPDLVDRIQTAADAPAILQIFSEIPLRSLPPDTGPKSSSQPTVSNR